MIKEAAAAPSHDDSKSGTAAAVSAAAPISGESIKTVLELEEELSELSGDPELYVKEKYLIERIQLNESMSSTVFPCMHGFTQFLSKRNAMKL